MSSAKSIAIQKKNTACLSDKYQKSPLVTVMYFIHLFIYHTNAFKKARIIKKTWEQSMDIPLAGPFLPPLGSDAL